MTLVDTTTGEIVSVCSPEEARALTDQIKGATEALWSLLAEAHDRQAWRALGYDTFKGYVQSEFGMSKQNAYRLLDQARVLDAITEASGHARVTPVLSQRAADELKDDLPLVAERVRVAVADAEPEYVEAAVEAAIETVRTEIREQRITKPEVAEGGVSHPARYTAALVPVFADILDGYDRVLDPFAGTGQRLAALAETHELVGIELEPEWANVSEWVQQGNALDLPFPDDSFDAICTSPTYGNRLADHHNASDPESRRSYTHDLGRQLHADNSGAMQWGDEYRSFHDAAWCEAVRVLGPGGLFVLNIKDHIRNGKRQYVSGWHVTTLIRLGLEYLYEVPVDAPSMRAGANSEARIGSEMVYVLRKP